MRASWAGAWRMALATGRKPERFQVESAAVSTKESHMTEVVKTIIAKPAFPVQKVNSDGSPAVLHAGINTVEYFAAKAMAALINAAWSNPEPAKRAYIEWSAEQPPDQPGSFGDWVADLSMSYAATLVEGLNVNKTKPPMTDA